MSRTNSFMSCLSGRHGLEHSIGSQNPAATLRLRSRLFSHDTFEVMIFIITKYPGSDITKKPSSMYKYIGRVCDQRSSVHRMFPMILITNLNAALARIVVGNK